MLEAADIEIEEVITALAGFGVDAAFLVPTATGLGKSIMDAHAELRAFLSLRDIHDFEGQGQGPEGKVVLEAQLVGAERLEDARVSLYRPATKNGDPRIWISGLPGYADAGNLLALITDGSNRLYVVNCSHREIFDSRTTEGSPLNVLLTDGQERGAADELLAKLRAIAARGFVPATGFGDHTVGDTLEALLGISTNSKKTPDFKGIEIKSGRTKSGSSGKKSIFSQIPSWKTSHFATARDLLDRFGYVDPEKQRLQLYCTITTRPNPNGFFLSVDLERAVLEVRVMNEEDQCSPVVEWSLTHLDDRLAKKHPETFWVKVDVERDEHERELFRYSRVTHTRAPLLANFRHMLSTGRVMLDFTLSEKEGGTIRDHGYLFRITDRDIPLLFSNPIEHNLLEKAAV